MGDLVERLREAFRTFPVIEESPVDLFEEAADKLESAESLNRELLNAVGGWCRVEEMFCENLKYKKALRELRGLLNNQSSKQEGGDES